MRRRFLAIPFAGLTALAVVAVTNSTEEPEHTAQVDVAQANANAEPPRELDSGISWASAASLRAGVRHERAQAAADERLAKELAAIAKKKKQAKKKKAKKLAAEGLGPIPTASSPKSPEILRLVKTHFPADQVGNAMATAACESGHSDAKGSTNSDGTTDWGVFQLNDGGTLQASLRAIGVSFSSTEEAQRLALQTEINVKAAASIYRSRGWAPWVCAYKIRIVNSLYSNSPGPMAGKFDQWGKPTVPVPSVPVGPAPSNPDSSTDQDNSKSEPKQKSKKPTSTPSAQPSPAPSSGDNGEVTPTPLPSIVPDDDSADEVDPQTASPS